MKDTEDLKTGTINLYSNDHNQLTLGLSILQSIHYYLLCYIDTVYPAVIVHHLPFLTIIVLSPSVPRLIRHIQEEARHAAI